MTSGHNSRRDKKFLPFGAHTDEVWKHKAGIVTADTSWFLQIPELGIHKGSYSPWASKLGVPLEDRGEAAGQDPNPTRAPRISTWHTSRAALLSTRQMG